MCFSSQASFITSGVLFPLGLYSTIRAFKSNKHYILFSLIPFIFGIHQFIEGTIWEKLHANTYTFQYQNILAFTFIAFFIWPVYIPLSIYQIEPRFQRKQILKGLTILGLILSVAIYLPILTGAAWIGVEVVNKSITYPVGQPLYLQKIYTLAYVTIICASLFLCSFKTIKIFGLLLLISFVLSLLWFYFALTSVWCFFAALLSTYIVWLMHKLPNIKSFN